MRIRSPAVKIRNPKSETRKAKYEERGSGAVSDFRFRIFTLSLLTGQLGQVNLLKLAANLIPTLFADRFQLAVEGTIRRESAFAILSRGLMAKECPPRLFLNHAFLQAGARLIQPGVRLMDSPRLEREGTE